MAEPLKVGARVRVVRLADETGEARFVGKCGTVVGMDTSDCGAADDPFYEVHSRRAGVSHFWAEELEALESSHV